MVSQTDKACVDAVTCVQDWGKVAYDLQNLGFIPEDVGDDMLQEMSGPLGRILSQLSGGGGATKLNIDAGKTCTAVCLHVCQDALAQAAPPASSASQPHWQLCRCLAWHFAANHFRAYTRRLDD